MEIEGPICILIAEGHSIFALGLRSCIESYGEGVRFLGVAEDGQEAVSLAESLNPNVILMDIHLAKVSGLDATKKIRSMFPHIEVIILAADDQMKNINDALLAGASGYVLKSVTQDGLLTAIRNVAHGGSAFSPEVSQRLISILRNPRLEMNALSAEDRQILDYMAEGWTNESIGNALSLSVSTVEVHARNILQKLGVSLRTQAVASAIRNHLI